jgi:hypothetical protein
LITRIIFGDEYRSLSSSLCSTAKCDPVLNYAQCCENLRKGEALIRKYTELSNQLHAHGRFAPVETHPSTHRKLYELQNRSRYCAGVLHTIRTPHGSTTRAAHSTAGWDPHSINSDVCVHNTHNSSLHTPEKALVYCFSYINIVFWKLCSTYCMFWAFNPLKPSGNFTYH